MAKPRYGIGKPALSAKPAKFDSFVQRMVAEGRGAKPKPPRQSKKAPLPPVVG